MRPKKRRSRDFFVCQVAGVRRENRYCIVPYRPQQRVTSYKSCRASPATLSMSYYSGLCIQKRSAKLGVLTSEKDFSPRRTTLERAKMLDAAGANCMEGESNKRGQGAGMPRAWSLRRRRKRCDCCCTVNAFSLAIAAKGEQCQCINARKVINFQLPSVNDPERSPRNAFAHKPWFWVVNLYRCESLTSGSYGNQRYKYEVAQRAENRFKGQCFLNNPWRITFLQLVIPCAEQGLELGAWPHRAR
jgi:hypothetical protein